MCIVIYPRKSYRHPALREPVAACAVYGDWPILGAKINNKNETCKNSAEKIEFIGEFIDSSIYIPNISDIRLLPS